MAITTVNALGTARDFGLHGKRPLGEQVLNVFRAVGRSLMKAAERQGARRASQELRHIARSFEGSQPHLAADLHAAATRCEGLLNTER